MKMPVNHFKKNRIDIQKAAVSTFFLKRLTSDDLPFEIVETKNVGEDGKLKLVRIDNIPVNDVIPISFVLNMEIEDSIFSAPQHCKKVERVIVLFSCWSLYIIMVEMKSTLELYEDGSISKIEQKIKDSLVRVLLFLNHYALDEKSFDDYIVNFHALILYNKEKISQQIIKDETRKHNELVKVFLGDKDSFWVKSNELAAEYKVKTIFKQNAPDSEEFDLDLSLVFDGDEDFENAIYSDKTLP